MRECEIDLVAEHRVVSVIGLSPADALLCPAGVSGARALPGKALIYLFLLSRLTLKVTASVRACMCASGCDHSLQGWGHMGVQIKKNIFISQASSMETDVAVSSQCTVRCSVVEERLSGISSRVSISITSSFNS